MQKKICQNEIKMISIQKYCGKIAVAVVYFNKLK